MPVDRSTETPVTRRSLLAWGGVLASSPLLAGCGLDLSDVRLDDVPTPTPPVLGPDDLARFAAIERLTVLQQMASALARDTPPQAQAVQEQAAAAEADHTEHLAQLGPLPGPVPSPSSTPEGWPTSTASAPPGEPSPKLLGEAENACAVDLLGRVGEIGGALARLLASIATSCGARGVELAGLAGSPPPAPLVPGTATASLAEADADALRELPPAHRTALETLVAAHHAASYAYGVLAVRLEGSSRKKAVEAIGRHRTDAEGLTAAAAKIGMELPPAAPAYQVPAVADAAAAVALAERLELDVAEAGAALVASEVAELRTVGVEQLVTAGLYATIWAPLPPFPGMSELA
jgi:hypothetical protein